MDIDDVGPASEKAGTQFYQASTRNVERKCFSPSLDIAISICCSFTQTCDDAFCVTQSGSLCWKGAHREKAFVLYSCVRAVFYYYGTDFCSKTIVK